MNEHLDLITIVFLTMIVINERLERGTDILKNNLILSFHLDLRSIVYFCGHALDD